MGATALYQIWAGSKQKELGLGSMQLLHQYVPLAAGLLAVLVRQGGLGGVQMVAEPVQSGELPLAIRAARCAACNLHISCLPARWPTPPTCLPRGPQVPLCEPMGWSSQGPGTILGYTFTPGSVVAIAISSVLGLLVNLSTFLVRYAALCCGMLQCACACHLGAPSCCDCAASAAVQLRRAAACCARASRLHAAAPGTMCTSDLASTAAGTHSTAPCR